MHDEINRLREQIRTLKRMLLGVFGLVAVGVLLAATNRQSVPDVIQAKKFEVVDGEGQPIVLITANDIGGLVKIQNGRGKSLVEMTSHREGGTISVHDSQSRTLVLVGGNERGSGALQTRSNKGRTLVVLGTDQAGGGIVFTEDGRGEKTSAMP